MQKQSRDEMSFFDGRLLTYKEAASYLSLSESYLRRLKKKKQIGCVCIGNRGVRFRLSTLNSWVEKRETKSR